MKNHIVLFEPRMPANTGNIARTCAGTNAVLHLIEPLGFSTDDKMLKRSGLDYWHAVEVVYHANLQAFLETVGDNNLFLVTKFAPKTYAQASYVSQKDNYFIFGSETDGLPKEFMRAYKENCIRIPMNDEHIRSLNLSNAAAIIIYEALKQQSFEGLELVHTYDVDKARELGW